MSEKVYKILHVDDDQNFIDMVKIMLKGVQFKVDNAYNGADAVTKAFRNKYDIIIMDIMMPIMDGKVASKTIKGMSPNIPILALTAYDVDDLNSYNIDYTLRKPITKEVLLKNITYILENSKKYDNNI